MSAGARHALAASAGEMDALSVCGAAVERVLNRLMKEGALDSAAIMEAQSMDLLIQTLRELAAFMRAIAAHADPNSPAALNCALADVKLGALAGRLADACNLGAPRDAESTAIELF